ncbi:MAG: hypothetical protein ACYTBJ_01220 [Planctomycetota bacterium]|jgi:hypothetical protein
MQASKGNIHVFEYKTETFTLYRMTYVDEWINALAKNGWKLHTYTIQGERIHIVMQRRINGD